jgi:hypothetical protein
MKGNPLSLHKKHKVTHLEHTIGMRAFSARKKHQGATTGTTSDASVVVTQWSQTLDYFFHDSPPCCSPFVSPVVHPVGSPLANANAINNMITRGPVGGLTLGDKATVRQLFETGVLVSEHNQKKSKLNAFKLTDLSVFHWICQSIKQLKEDLQDKRQKEVISLVVVKRAPNFFDTTTYQKYAKVKPGKSI